jgi:hypothetical protein
MIGSNEMPRWWCAHGRQARFVAALGKTLHRGDCELS